jgi:F-type H+-transporting ATPase subunit delta
VSDAASIGAVYAEALAGAADAKGALEPVGDELDAFATLWRKDADVRTFFLSGAIPAEAKRKAIAVLTHARASETFTGFLSVLARRNRLWLVPAVADAYRRILDVRTNRVPVTLSTAAPVSPADLDAWRARLRASLGKEPVLVHEVKPALIGGAVLRVGDTVADGSVRRRLVELRTRFAKAGAP